MKSLKLLFIITICLLPHLTKAQNEVKYMLLESKDTIGLPSRYKVRKGQKVEIVTLDNKILKSRISFKTEDSLIINKKAIHINEIKRMTFPNYKNYWITSLSLSVGTYLIIQGANDLDRYYNAPSNRNRFGYRFTGNLCILLGISSYASAVSILRDTKSINMKYYNYQLVPKG